jgi:outer membrane protein assembly factor BamE
MKRNILILTLILVSFGLSGCIKPHVPDVQQGNVIDQSAKDSLRLGMSKNEVRNLLGDPVLVSSLSKNCWFYAYTNQINGGKVTMQNLKLCFDSNDDLASMQNNTGEIKK